MFNFPKLSSIVLANIYRENEQVKSLPKRVSEGLCLILHPEAKSLMDNTFFNHFYSGENKGGSFYGAIKEEIEKKGFSPYLFDVEKRFRESNNRENKFSLTVMTKEFYEAVTQAANLTGSIQKGLIQSYLKNSENRPYLFLAECLYYSLETQKSSVATYKDLQFTQETELANSVLDILTIDSKKYSSRTIHELNMLSKYEVKLFEKVAPFTFFDEAFDELSGEYVRDQQLISHEEFFDLYETYNVKAVDITKLRECRLISGGGHHELVIETDYLSGFQNDDLVLTATTDGDRFIFNYGAFHLTQSAVDLIEILGITYNNDFFMALGEHFKEKIKDESVQISVIKVDEF